MDALQLTGGRPIAIVGAGLVGTGWAIVFARAGLTVRIYDANQSVAGASIPLIAEQLDGLHKHGLMQELPSKVMERLVLTRTLADAVEQAVYVQESVLERVDVKRKVMTELEQVAGDDLVIGSSSSGIPASCFANDLKISPRVLIAHPVNPPYIVPVVELVPSTQTSKEAVAFADALMQAAGQSVVHVRKEVEGFVLNRLQGALLREAWALVQDGVASCEDIDKTVRDGLGWRWSFMGPFETIDLNAPGGVADYAARLGPLYLSIAQSRQHDEPWSDELIRLVESERRKYLGKEDLQSRRAWRDEQLMRLAAFRKQSED